MKTARYPCKNKAHYNTKWAKDGFRIGVNGKIELSMGIHGGKREQPIVVYTKHLPQGKIKEIELCFDHGLYLSVAFEDGKENQPYAKKQSSGVDLGEIHTIAAFAESGDALIITGRKVRAIHRLRNKKVSQIQRLQSKCKKGSRQWKTYQKAKRYVLSKSEKQLQDVPPGKFVQGPAEYIPRGPVHPARTSHAVISPLLPTLIGSPEEGLVFRWSDKTLALERRRKTNSCDQSKTKVAGWATIPISACLSYLPVHCQ